MNRILYVLVTVIAFLSCFPASADVFGDADDRYVGIQVTIPLERNYSSLSPAKFEYSAMIVDQRDGLREGVAFTIGTDGSRTLAYLRPSYDFKIGQSRVSNHAIPLTQYDQNGLSRVTLDGGVVLISLAIGAVAVMKLVEDAAESLADCVSGEDEDCEDEED